MTVLPRLAFALSVTGLLTAGASAQTPARDSSRPAAPVAGTASITGVVTMAGSGQPAARARVSLGGNSTPRNTSTDELGRFAFTALPAGRYSLNASKSGCLGASYGQSRPGRPGTPVQLADGQEFEARLQMYRGGVLTGTIVDEHGELTAGTPVRVMRWNLQSGQRVLQSAGAGTTDDRGIYRVYGLQPGDYIVTATPRNSLSEADRMRQEIESIRQVESTGRLDDDQARELAQRASQLQGLLGEDDEQPTGYAPVYYPGTTTPAQAAAISLDAGEERVGLDFQLLRVAVARVEGTVINATGQPLPNVQIRLLPAGAGFTGQTASARADREGRFRLFNVAPGAYTIAATATVNPAVRAQPAGGGGPVTRPEPQRVLGDGGSAG